MMVRTRRLVLLGLPALTLLTPVPGFGTGALEAQRAEVTRVSSPTGWIGISVEMRSAVEGTGAAETVVEITEVRPDGPAARAGLRAGDVLLSINGRSPEAGFVDMVGSLAPGDPVSAVVRRDGERIRFRFEAGARPHQVTGPTTYEVLVRADTLADRMYRAMDSLRVRIATGQLPGVPSRTATVGLLRRARAVDSLVTVFQGPGGLRGRAEVTPVFPDTLDGRRGADEGRRPFRLLFLSEDSVAPGGTTGRVPAAVVQRGGEDAPPGSEIHVRLRPLAPYALGRNRAAGAEVVELKPELAEYFAVERGVLVVEVASGTPAARAGLLPGDVLTGIGGASVGSVADVRLGLSRPADSLAVRLVRKGAPMELVLRRW